jgi:methionine aminotransferase
MTLRFQSKLPDIGTTIFSVMTKMALDYNAINLSQGYPDFAVPEELIDRLDYYLRKGENQYPPMQGIDYLREQIAVKISDCYAAVVDPATEITVTSGATEAIFVALQAIVDQGKEVIVFDPAYDAYDPAITLAGGRAIHIPLSGPDFQIDWTRVESAITATTCAIVLNSPHNPTGAVLQARDLEELARLTRDRNITVVSDEVYEHMVFDGVQHFSLAGHPELRTRTYVISSFGKTYHATGWKVGYCSAPADMTTEFRKIHQFVTFTTHTPTQWAIADFLEHHPEHHQQLPQFYAAKRDLFLSELQDSGFSMVPSRGTYFQLAGYDEISNSNDVDFTGYLTREVGVAAIPISVFYETPPANRLVRFCFAKADETLKKAAGMLAQLERLP